MAVQALSVLWLHNMTCEAWLCTAQASQVILCSHNTDNACTAIYVSTWTKCVILAKRWLAPLWWFPCKTKHVGAAFLILICFNKLYMCISWTIKGLISLMHGITMKITELSTKVRNYEILFPIHDYGTFVLRWEYQRCFVFVWSVKVSPGWLRTLKIDLLEI